MRLPSKDLSSLRGSRLGLQNGREQVLDHTGLSLLPSLLDGLDFLLRLLVRLVLGLLVAFAML